ncbi:MAG: type IV pilus twitching motility protein PilT [Gammaproteobacteria bacterium]|nr:type IV pilus twitching motility protein PilT [Gammaproteobacteria bacterium]MYC52060.1 type IV pilus twitching motility protein PilT [Gammaproteobacteria bacterium]
MTDTTAAFPNPASGPVEDRHGFPPALRALLEEMVERDASDLHVTAGIPPRLRIDGELADARRGGALAPQEAAELVDSVLTRARREQLAAGGEIDFAFDLAGIARFRCSCHRQRGQPAMALRRIPHEIPRLEDLRLPGVVRRLVERPHGLVLVTGPTGSGKSTTLAAMLSRINETRKGHIVTIEDPVEFVHPSRGCVVSQREVGSDTMSFAAALKSATRQDPDVILIGEMRDPETIAAVLTIAETGHLVLATLHTNAAAASVHRIIDVFESGRQAQVRAQLALVLEGVVTQNLLQRARGRGRVAACEVLICTPAVRAAIRDRKVHQIPSMMQAGRKHGMQTMNDALRQLRMRGEVSTEAAMRVSPDPAELLRSLGDPRRS